MSKNEPKPEKTKKLKRDVDVLSLLNLFKTLDLSINILNYLKFKCLNRLLNVTNKEFHELLKFLIFEQECTVAEFQFTLYSDKLNFTPPHKNFFKRLKHLQLEITQNLMTGDLINELIISLAKFKNNKLKTFKLKFKGRRATDEFRFDSKNRIIIFQDLIYDFICENGIKNFQSDMCFCFKMENIQKLCYVNKLILPDFIWDKRTTTSVIKNEVDTFKLKTKNAINGVYGNNTIFKPLTVKTQFHIEITRTRNILGVLGSIFFEKRQGESFFKDWIIKTVNGVKVFTVLVSEVRYPGIRVKKSPFSLETLLSKTSPPKKKFITNFNYFTHLKFTSITLLDFWNLKILSKIFCNYKFKGYEYINIQFRQSLGESTPRFLTTLCDFLKNITCKRVDLTLGLRENIIESILLKSLKDMKMKELFIVLVPFNVISKEKKNIFKQFNQNVQINLQ